jgi:hypothetical protein
MIDWEHIRRVKFSDERPDDWPAGVKAISQEGLALFGIHDKTGRLYWDGDEILTSLRLGKREFILAVIVAVSAAVTAAATIAPPIIELMKIYGKIP